MTANYEKRMLLVRFRYIWSDITFLRGVFNKYVEKCCHIFNTRGKFTFSLHVVNKQRVNVYKKISKSDKLNYKISCTRVISVKPGHAVTTSRLTHVRVSPKTRAYSFSKYSPWKETHFFTTVDPWPETIKVGIAIYLRNCTLHRVRQLVHVIEVFSPQKVLQCGDQK
jgi:hypothetical protein